MSKTYLATTGIASTDSGQYLFCWDSRYDHVIICTDTTVTGANLMRKTKSLEVNRKGTLIGGGGWLYNVVVSGSTTYVQIIDGSNPTSIIREMTFNWAIKSYCTDDSYFYAVKLNVCAYGAARVYKIDVYNDNADVAHYDGQARSPDAFLKYEWTAGNMICDGTTLWWLNTTSDSPTINDASYWSVLQVSDMTRTAHTYCSYILLADVYSHLVKDDTYIAYWYHNGATSWNLSRVAIAALGTWAQADPSAHTETAFISGGYVYDAVTDAGANNDIRKTPLSTMSVASTAHTVLPTGLGVYSDGTSVWWDGVNKTNDGVVGAAKAQLSDYAWIESIWEAPEDIIHSFPWIGKFQLSHVTA